MLPNALSGPVLALLSVCTASALLETLTRDERAALSYRALCALAVAVCALRAVMRFLN